MKAIKGVPSAATRAAIIGQRRTYSLSVRTILFNGCVY